MPTSNRILIAGLAAAVALLAAGKQNPAPPGVLEVAASTETVPPGGTAQAQFSLTEPHPISSTGASYDLGDMSVNGVAIFSPAGDAGGVGVVKNRSLYVSAISPTANLGTNIDYPFLTITTGVPATAAIGSKYSVNWGSGSSITTTTGPMPLSVKAGTLTIGGSVSIRGLYPGGGTWPAGTLVRLIGLGFKANTRFQMTFKASLITVVSPNEVDLILKETTALDNQKVQAVNPDGSAATYFSYLRGVLVRTPVRGLLQNSEPAFPIQTHALASMVVPTLTASQFAGLALQNPNTGPLVVTFELDSAAGGTQVTSVLLPSGGRLVDDLSSLLNGATVNAGDTFRLTATAPLQILGLLGDETPYTLTPFFPTF